MHQPIPTNSLFTSIAHSSLRIIICACLTATAAGVGVAQAQAPQGSIPNTGFIALAGGSLSSWGGGACCDTNGADQGCRENVSQADCSDADDTWTENATCAEVSCQCIPDCAGRECGDDGCNGACGNCDDGDVCTDDSCFEGTCLYGILDPCCHPVPCGIPTVSEWGLAFLTLTGLIAGTLLFGRKASRM